MKQGRGGEKKGSSHQDHIGPLIIRYPLIADAYNYAWRFSWLLFLSTALPLNRRNE